MIYLSFCCPPPYDSTIFMSQCFSVFSIPVGKSFWKKQITCGWRCHFFERTNKCCIKITSLWNLLSVHKTSLWTNKCWLLKKKCWNLWRWFNSSLSCTKKGLVIFSKTTKNHYYSHKISIAREHLGMKECSSFSQYTIKTPCNK